MSEPRLRRVAHPLRLVGFAVLVLVLVGTAFIVGRSVKDPNDEAFRAAEQHIEVYSKAEERVVDNGHSWQGEVRAGGQAEVSLAVPPDERAVVTRAVVKVGDTVEPGDLISVVSGRPRILIPASVPLYRDLRVEDRGDDVAALQDFLTSINLYSGSGDGRFDWTTEVALRELFTSHGYDLPTEKTTVTSTPNEDEPPVETEVDVVVVRWQEFVQFPQNSGTVVAVTPTATVLDDNLVLCQVQVSAPTVRFILPLDAEGVLEKGTKVTIAGAEGELESIVRSVGEFSAASEDQVIAGFPVTVTLPADATLRVGSPVRVSVPGESGEAQLAVPTVAIKQGAQGTYVSVRTDSGRIDVAVRVLAQQGGWTAIEPENPDLLAAGTDVLVS